MSACLLTADKLIRFISLLFALSIGDKKHFDSHNLSLLFQSGCEERNECQNGGKMAWDPLKPFKCQCPNNYYGERCEKCELLS